MRIFKGFFGNKAEEVDYGRMPLHIAIIMDGNGRWAKKRGLPRNLGHREGSNTLRRVVADCCDLGIKYLTVYAFSKENWKRPENEVEALMGLLLEYLKNADRELAGRDIRIRILGDAAGLSEEIVREIARVERSTRDNKGLNLLIALNYGGRDEIVHAVRSIAEACARNKLKAEDICETTIAERLYSAGIPDPDLVIRTSGEKRISNFLLWQSAYAEFWFTDVLWPDFGKRHLLNAIKEYQTRNRRFGGI